MWVVRLALRRPYTIAVAAISIFLFGLLAVQKMLIDIFPAIDIPVAAVVWQYPGLSALEVERRIVSIHERAISSNVNGIAGIESQSIPGSGIVRVFFQDGNDLATSISQISAISNFATRLMPPGISPPLVVPFNASNLPIGQVTLTSETVPEQQMYDWGQNVLRNKIFTIRGLTVPAPYGGMIRQITVDLDRRRLLGKGISPVEVINAMQSSNLVLPAGIARLGAIDYNVSLNSSPSSVEQMQFIPIKIVNGAPVLVGDVAKVADANAEQTNAVRINGRRSTFLNLIKKIDGSTLKVINSVRELLPSLQTLAPEGLSLSVDFDQSVFVRSAILNVLVEAAISSALVSFMIFAFLGSWRSVVVVCTSIPLAILCGLIGLHWTGNSINIMTLGGLALAIGMLVDDATVEIENIHRNRALGLPLMPAILVGASQIAQPAIMATLSICIVFFPVVFLTGPSRFLFIPMALAVVFSMLASYVLSRTVVPLLAHMLLQGESPGENHGFRLFERSFQFLLKIYERCLHTVLGNRDVAVFGAFCLVVVSCYLPPVIGMDFFPNVDAGLIKLHFRAPPGSSLQETEKLVARLEAEIREIIPANEIDKINSMLGVPTIGNLAYSKTDNVAGMDADLLVSLKAKHRSTDQYKSSIRKRIGEMFPGCVAYFQDADIVNQVLNFAQGSQIDVQIEGTDFEKSFEIARNLREKMEREPGLVDVRIKQLLDYPAIKISVDRVRAARVGLTQRDVANNMLISLSGSSILTPTYFLNPVNNIQYPVAVRMPTRAIASVDDLLATPVGSAGVFGDGGGQPALLDLAGPRAQTLGNLAQSFPELTFSEINHVDIQRVIDVNANVEGRDLASTLKRVDKIISDLGKLPSGTVVRVRGQGELMNEAFKKLGLGLVVSIFLVYLLLVVLYQSWLDPLIVLAAIPGALIGILWMLFLTGTTINIESFMGSIMAIGIAASNSILLVSFANDVRLEKDLSPLDAALLAGKTRLRPVLMTALAMIFGMLPAALGLGEGGEQNAPLGRAVIGGLVMATLFTLFFVPVVYSLLRTKLPSLHLLQERLATEEKEASGV